MSATISNIDNGMSVKPIRRQVSHDSFDCSAKDDENRKEVLSLFRRLTYKDKVLSLPGEKWIFENELHDDCGVTVTGVEHNETTFLKMGGYAPRCGRFRYWQLESPQGSLDVGSNACCCVLKSSLYDLLTNSRAFSGHQVGTGVNIHRAWYRFKKQHRGAWLDSCSTLSTKMLCAMSALARWLDLSACAVPFALTFMRARDGFQSDEDRRNVLEAAIQATGEVMVVDATYKNYAGIGGAPMCLLTCELIPNKTKDPNRTVKKQAFHAYK